MRSRSTMRSLTHKLGILVLTILFSTGLAFAQEKKVLLTGTVLESEGQQPVEYATVIAADLQTEKAISGTTTAADGSFSLAVPHDRIYLEIRFIGFEDKKVTDIPIVNGKANFGTILLTNTQVELDGVVIESEKSQTVFKLDKRVFNVGSDLSSTGASALELLNNVPSVNVDIEGQISLRGSNGVQVLINGKPSVLASDEGNALGTITSDMIDKIEVITNPSAKYEAEGTAGIINIVLKKDERKGVNGSVSLNTGWPHNHSIGLSLNRRTEKFNLFSQIGAGYRSLPRYNENINQNLSTGISLLNDGTNYRDETFFNIVLGTDYHINKYNVLTLSGNFAYEIEDQPSRTNFTSLDGNGDLISEWYRTENTQALNPKWQYELQYKKDFKDNEEHTLLFSAIGNFFGKDLSSDFENIATTGTITDLPQQTATDFSEARNTFQIDYTHPFSEKWTIETGAHYSIQDVQNDYTVSNFFNEEWVADSGLTNVFEFDQKVLGIYGTGALELDRWGVKAGLRLENTDLKTLLATTGEANDRNYTNLFPSLHTSYKVNERFSMQAGYSRRIFRPRLWDLNPFFNIRNNYSIRTGNPDLQPEFTDSYEITAIYILDKLSLNASIFHRFTTNSIERISTFSENVTTVMPANIGTNRSTGLEFNAKYTPNKWLVLSGDFNYNYFIRRGTFEGRNFDFDATRWSSKVTSKFKLPAAIDLEVTGHYRSVYLTVQGRVSQNIFGDFGIRKKLLSGKAVVNLSVRDIFASRINETEIQQEDFYSYSFGQRGRFITLGFSYGFGKGEAMEYSGGRRRR